MTNSPYSTVARHIIYRFYFKMQASINKPSILTVHSNKKIARIRGYSTVHGFIMTKAALTLEIKQLLIDTLSLDIKPDDMDDDALLLGDIPEFDSMAIVSVITGLEGSYGFTSADDELTAEVFESIGTVVDFVLEQTK